MQELTPYQFNASILAGQISASSMKAYQQDFKQYHEYAETSENAAKPETLATWIIKLVEETKYSPNTINRKVAAVKRVMKQALIHRLIDKETYETFKMVSGVSASAMKDRKRTRNRIRIKPETIRAIIDSIDDSSIIGKRNKAFFTALASSGLRIHEFTHLKQDQVIERDGKYLLIMYAEEGKNQNEDREANISVEAVNYIRDWLDIRPVASEYIFTACGGRGDRFLSTPISAQKAWLLVKDIAEPFVPGIKPHDLRRFVGTQLASIDPHKARLALGHKKVETTLQHYVLTEIQAGETDNLF